MSQISNWEIFCTLSETASEFSEKRTHPSTFISLWSKHGYVDQPLDEVFEGGQVEQVVDLLDVLLHGVELDDVEHHNDELREVDAQQVAFLGLEPLGVDDERHILDSFV